MALVASSEIDPFADNIFSFPHLAEAYPVVALDVVGQRAARASALPREN